MILKRRTERGFALVEAMVALAIVAGMSVLFFQTLSGSSRAAEGIEVRRLAVLIAQSQLAAAEAGAIRPGEEGESAGMHWSLSAEPWEQTARSGGLQLQKLQVSVSLAGSSRPVMVLESLRASR
ncbi:MAG: PulJ/GspJ family protein [Novosphingobium sp.]